MTDTPPNESVHVTAEERPHPALQKLARALIALARLRREAEQAATPPSENPPVVFPGDDAEVCHG